MALHAGENFTVQGLYADAEQVATARDFAMRHGLYGAVSFDQLPETTLPYADNLINLIVVDDLALAARNEILRVLVPGGVAMIRENGGWHKTVKHWPDNIDEWTHYLHDAGGNAVAADEVVGLPRSLQWVAPPLWLRSHETPSGFEGMVSGGGRVFYFLDEGLIGITDQRLPERWSLICRDAFNGRLLWKRKLGAWGWPEWAPDRFRDQDWRNVRGGRTEVPEQNQRRLVVDGDRLYATLAYQAPLSILDARDGHVIATIAETDAVKEILASGGRVVVHSETPGADAAQRRGDRSKQASHLIAIDGATDDILWKRPVPLIRTLMLAADEGRVVYQVDSKLTALDLADGDVLWQVKAPKGRSRTLIATDKTIVLYVRNALYTYDARTGDELWHQDNVPPSSGGESPDLFVCNGLVWRGIVPVTDDLKPAAKSENAMAVAYDLRSGKKKRQIVVPRLRSPEHHHRCYRNKATERFIISGMEGTEFLDLVGHDHGQNNWLRGACKLGVMPSNGLLYVPPDQCFCQPGSKVLGFAAVAAHRPERDIARDDAARLERGPAYDQVDRSINLVNEEDWPTFRYNAARHGATTNKVAADVRRAWRRKLGGRLTAPVSAGGRVYVASVDAHTVYALDVASGKIDWKFIAGGRVDSPPTIFGGLVLFGSADGHVYCLRAADGALVWRFLAAPIDRRISCFDQFESVWPVHGSILVRDGVAYCTAGRSTYLDGGVRLYGLDPYRGQILHRGLLKGPIPDLEQNERDLAFYLPGANSDVLVSEGDHLYMRQKKLTLDLQEVVPPVLSSKGAQDVGLHVFSTSGLLDGSWYNRAFWMYSSRWPGFQLANQAPKTGQLLVIDDQRTYALRVFYLRNVHSPMFFPGREGYLLFADENSNEPQILGDQGSRTPLAWLPQSDIPRAGNPGLDSRKYGFGADKGIGYTRAEPPVWTAWIPVRIRAMVKAGSTLFAAGPPDVLKADDPYAAFQGRRGLIVGSVGQGR